MFYFQLFKQEAIVVIIVIIVFITAVFVITRDYFEFQ